ncbi:hypothetical protein TrLO_g6844 [Triparma laevis f. longispina]|uniref:Phosphotyrosine protein phosphatase I domain-containing protein n=1 Tax=Triparma laevis f. longispina TaxID=1714387 RepID=A0A9W7KS29_9STRA|nr:hypothetical protein TrLO_g6844 [Triparma laevis f. longispina]
MADSPTPSSTLSSAGVISPTSSATRPLTICYVCTSNVCRSPMAAAIASSILASGLLSSSLPPIRVISRGLTDNYSKWGSSASNRMVTAAGARLAKSPLAQTHISNFLSLHKSTPMTREEASDPNTIIFLVTSKHISWLSSAVTPEITNSATSQNRLKQIDSPDPSTNHDIADPYFGDQNDYDLVCSHLLYSVPLSLMRVLVERGCVGEDERKAVEEDVKGKGDWGGEMLEVAREFGRMQGQAG